MPDSAPIPDSILLLTLLLENVWLGQLSSYSKASPDAGYSKDTASGSISCRSAARQECSVAMVFLYEDIDPGT